MKFQDTKAPTVETKTDPNSNPEPLSSASFARHKAEHRIEVRQEQKADQILELREQVNLRLTESQLPRITLTPAGSFRTSVSASTTRERDIHHQNALIDFGPKGKKKGFLSSFGLSASLQFALELVAQINPRAAEQAAEKIAEVVKKSPEGLGTAHLMVNAATAIFKALSRSEVVDLVKVFTAKDTAQTLRDIANALNKMLEGEEQDGTTFEAYKVSTPHEEEQPVKAKKPENDDQTAQKSTGVENMTGVAPTVASEPAEYWKARSRLSLDQLSKAGLSDKEARSILDAAAALRAKAAQGIPEEELAQVSDALVAVILKVNGKAVSSETRLEMVKTLAFVLKFSMNERSDSQTLSLAGALALDQHIFDIAGGKFVAPKWLQFVNEADLAVEPAYSTPFSLAAKPSLKSLESWGYSDQANREALCRKVDALIAAGCKENEKPEQLAARWADSLAKELSDQQLFRITGVRAKDGATLDELKAARKKAEGELALLLLDGAQKAVDSVSGKTSQNGTHTFSPVDTFFLGREFSILLSGTKLLEKTARSYLSGTNPDKVTAKELAVQLTATLSDRELASLLKIPFPEKPSAAFLVAIRGAAVFNLERYLADPVSEFVKASKKSGSGKVDLAEINFALGQIIIRVNRFQQSMMPADLHYHAACARYVEVRMSTASSQLLSSVQFRERSSENEFALIWQEKKETLSKGTAELVKRLCWAVPRDEALEAGALVANVIDKELKDFELPPLKLNGTLDEKFASELTQKRYVEEKSKLLAERIREALEAKYGKSFVAVLGADVEADLTKDIGRALKAYVTVIQLGAARLPEKVDSEAILSEIFVGIKAPKSGPPSTSVVEKIVAAPKKTEGGYSAADQKIYDELSKKLGSVHAKAVLALITELHSKDYTTELQSCGNDPDLAASKLSTEISIKLLAVLGDDAVVALFTDKIPPSDEVKAQWAQTFRVEMRTTLYDGLKAIFSERKSSKSTATSLSSDEQYTLGILRVIPDRQFRGRVVVPSVDTGAAAPSTSSAIPQTSKPSPVDPERTKFTFNPAEADKSSVLWLENVRSSEFLPKETLSDLRKLMAQLAFVRLRDVRGDANRPYDEFQTELAQALLQIFGKEPLAKRLGLTAAKDGSFDEKVVLAETKKFLAPILAKVLEEKDARRGPGDTDPIIGVSDVLEKAMVLLATEGVASNKGSPEINIAARVREQQGKEMYKPWDLLYLGLSNTAAQKLDALIKVIAALKPEERNESTNKQIVLLLIEVVDAGYLRKVFKILPSGDEAADRESLQKALYAFLQKKEFSPDSIRDLLQVEKLQKVTPLPNPQLFSGPLLEHFQSFWSEKPYFTDVQYVTMMRRHLSDVEWKEFLDSYYKATGGRSFLAELYLVMGTGRKLDPAALELFPEEERQRTIEYLATRYAEAEIVLESQIKAKKEEIKAKKEELKRLLGITNDDYSEATILTNLKTQLGSSDPELAKKAASCTSIEEVIALGGDQLRDKIKAALERRKKSKDGGLKEGGLFLGEDLEKTANFIADAVHAQDLRRELDATEKVIKGEVIAGTVDGSDTYGQLGRDLQSMEQALKHHRKSFLQQHWVLLHQTFREGRDSEKSFRFVDKLAFYEEMEPHLRDAAVQSAVDSSFILKNDFGIDSEAQPDFSACKDDEPKELQRKAASRLSTLQSLAANVERREELAELHWKAAQVEFEYLISKGQFGQVQARCKILAQQWRGTKLADTIAQYELAVTQLGKLHADCVRTLEIAKGAEAVVDEAHKSLNTTANGLTIDDSLDEDAKKRREDTKDAIRLRAAVLFRGISGDVHRLSTLEAKIRRDGSRLLNAVGNGTSAFRSVDLSSVFSDLGNEFKECKSWFDATFSATFAAYAVRNVGSDQEPKFEKDKGTYKDGELTDGVPDETSIEGISDSGKLALSKISGGYKRGLADLRRLWNQNQAPLSYNQTTPVVFQNTPDSATPLKAESGFTRSEGISAFLESWFKKNTLETPSESKLQKLFLRQPPEACAKLLAEIVASPKFTTEQRTLAESLLRRSPNGLVQFTGDAKALSAFLTELRKPDQSDRCGLVVMALLVSQQKEVLSAWSKGVPEREAIISAVTKLDGEKLGTFKESVWSEFVYQLNGPGDKTQKLFGGAYTSSQVVREVDRLLADPSPIPSRETMRAFLEALGGEHELLNELQKIPADNTLQLQAFFIKVTLELNKRLEKSDASLATLGSRGEDGNFLPFKGKELEAQQAKAGLLKNLAALRTLHLLVAVQGESQQNIEQVGKQLLTGAKPDPQTSALLLELQNLGSRADKNSGRPSVGKVVPKIFELLKQDSRLLSGFEATINVQKTNRELEAVMAQLTPAERADLNALYKKSTGMSIDDALIKKFQSSYADCYKSGSVGVAHLLAQKAAHSPALSTEAKDRLFPGARVGGAIVEFRVAALVEIDFKESSQKKLQRELYSVGKELLPVAYTAAGNRSLRPLAVMAGDSKALAKIVPDTDIDNLLSKPAPGFAWLFGQKGAAEKVADLEASANKISPGISERTGLRTQLRDELEAVAGRRFAELTRTDSKSSELLPVVTRILAEPAVTDEALAARAQRVQTAIRQANMDPFECKRLAYLYGLEQAAQNPNKQPVTALADAHGKPQELKRVTEATEQSNKQCDAEQLKALLKNPDVATESKVVGYFSRLTPEALKNAFALVPELTAKELEKFPKLSQLYTAQQALQKTDLALAALQPGKDGALTPEQTLQKARLEKVHDENIAVVRALTMWSEFSGGGYKTSREFLAEVLSYEKDPTRSADALARAVAVYSSDLGDTQAKSFERDALFYFGLESSHPEAKLWSAIGSGQKLEIAEQILAVAFRVDEVSPPKTVKGDGADGIDYVLASRAKRFAAPEQIDAVLKKLDDRILAALTADGKGEPGNPIESEMPPLFRLLHVRAGALPEKDRVNLVSGDMLFVLSLAAPNEISRDVLEQLRVQRILFAGHSETLKKLHKQTIDLQSQASGQAGEYRKIADEFKKEIEDGLFDKRKVFTESESANRSAERAWANHADYIKSDGTKRVENTQYAVGAAYLATVYQTLRDTNEAHLKREQLLGATSRTVAETQRYINHELRRVPTGWDQIAEELKRTAQLRADYDQKWVYLNIARDIAIGLAIGWIPYVGQVLAFGIILSLHVAELMKRYKYDDVFYAIWAHRKEILLMIAIQVATWGFGKILARILPKSTTLYASLLQSAEKRGVVVLKEVSARQPGFWSRVWDTALGAKMLDQKWIWWVKPGRFEQLAKEFIDAVKAANPGKEFVVFVVQANRRLPSFTFFPDALDAKKDPTEKISQTKTDKDREALVQLQVFRDPGQGKPADPKKKGDKAAAAGADGDKEKDDPKVVVKPGGPPAQAAAESKAEPKEGDNPIELKTAGGGIGKPGAAAVAGPLPMEVFYINGVAVEIPEGAIIVERDGEYYLVVPVPGGKSPLVYVLLDPNTAVGPIVFKDLNSKKEPAKDKDKDEAEKTDPGAVNYGVLRLHLHQFGYTNGINDGKSDFDKAFYDQYRTDFGKDFLNSAARHWKGILGDIGNNWRRPDHYPPPPPPPPVTPPPYVAPKKPGKGGGDGPGSFLGPIPTNGAGHQQAGKNSHGNSYTRAVEAEQRAKLDREKRAHDVGIAAVHLVDRTIPVASKVSNTNVASHANQIHQTSSLTQSNSLNASVVLSQSTSNYLQTANGLVNAASVPTANDIGLSNTIASSISMQFQVGEASRISGSAGNVKAIEQSAELYLRRKDLRTSDTQPITGVKGLHDIEQNADVLIKAELENKLDQVHVEHEVYLKNVEAAAGREIGDAVNAEASYSDNTALASSFDEVPLAQAKQDVSHFSDENEVATSLALTDEKRIVDEEIKAMEVALRAHIEKVAREQAVVDQQIRVLAAELLAQTDPNKGTSVTRMVASSGGGGNKPYSVGSDTGVSGLITDTLNSDFYGTSPLDDAADAQAESQRKRSERNKRRERARKQAARQRRLREALIHQLLTTMRSDNEEKQLLEMLILLGISQSEYRKLVAQLGERSAKNIVEDVATGRSGGLVRDVNNNVHKVHSDGTELYNTPSDQFTRNRTKAEVYRRLKGDADKKPLPMTMKSRLSSIHRVQRDRVAK